MSKYDEQLDRMNFLMEFKNEPKKVVSNIEYHANGADGKVYGILKEGTKYYIKTTEMGKENLAESYDYINGFVNRRENEYKSYNEATKQLELKLMSLNEAYGKKEDVSTVDFKRGEKVLATLTEEARKELDRMHQIMENCEKIGPNNVCDPESKGKATAEQTEKNNDPFNDKVTADMDYSGSKGSVGTANEGKDVKNVDSDLQSDKMKRDNSNLDKSGNDKEYKDAHDDLDGEGVADKRKSGGVTVNINEGIFEIGDGESMFPTAEPMDGIDGEEPTDMDMPLDGEEPVDMGEDPMNIPLDGEDPMDMPLDGGEPIDGVGDDVVGVDDEPITEEELDALLEDFMSNGTESKISGPDAVMDKEGNPINGTNNGVGDETGEDWKRVGDPVNIKEEDGYGETDKSEETETMDNYKFGYNDEKKLPVQSWDKMNVNEKKKMVKSLTESIYNSLIASNSNSKLENYIQRLVNEEVTKLDAWGKHPKYGKEPMTHPEAKEVLAGTADRDWNDDSAKGSERYGKKIGVGKPFTQETIDLLTDQVLAKIKGAYGK